MAAKESTENGPRQGEEDDGATQHLIVGGVGEQKAEQHQRRAAHIAQGARQEDERIERGRRLDSTKATKHGSGAAHVNHCADVTNALPLDHQIDAAHQSGRVC